MQVSVDDAPFCFLEGPGILGTPPRLSVTDKRRGGDVRVTRAGNGYMNARKYFSCVVAEISAGDGFFTITVRDK